MKFVFTTLFFLIGLMLWAQTEIVSDGIINEYGAVIGIDYCTNSMDLANNQENQFSIGDKVLIIQMKGAVLDAQIAPTNGNPIDLANCGNYEINEIKAINFTGIPGLQFQYNITRGYSVNGAVQVVKVAEYTNNVQFNNPLGCIPWDGSIGGVLIFEAGGEVILNAPINVSSNGFRGADLLVVPNECYNDITGEEFENYNCPIADQCGARKGEGIGAKYELDFGGKGRNGNGGGGGQNDNGGGGGGANAGLGGTGGSNDNIVTGFCEGSGGDGGALLNYSPANNKLFIGGGGGAGYQGNGQGTAGGNGGGLVFITANSLTSNGFSIDANGASVPTAGGDGSGGAGAGGTVVLNVNSLNDALVVNANGGDGGDILDNTNCPGLGGGGSGGAVWVKNGTLPANLTANVNGGDAGEHLSVTCNLVTMGVTAGGQGQVETNFPNSVADVLFQAISFVVGTDDTICTGESANLSATISSSFDFDFEWISNFGDTITDFNATVQPANNGVNVYTGVFSANTPGNCELTENVTITVRNPTMVLTLSPDTPINSGDVVFLNTFISPPNSNYEFSWTPSNLVVPNNSKDALAEPTQTTEFCITATDEFGCAKTVCETAEVLLDFVGAPNAFSPNNDGNNDFFQVVPTALLQQTMLRIYNRWGELIYQSNEVFEWDGKKDGIEQPQDVYLWTIDLIHKNTAEVTQQMGSVSLIR